jgi:PhnB protein
MHARLIFDGQVLMGADAPPQYYKQPQGFSLSLNVKERTEAERLFNALAEGGNVKMPFQKTFWSTGFGIPIDRFGTPWMVNCEQAA